MNPANVPMRPDDPESLRGEVYVLMCHPGMKPEAVEKVTRGVGAWVIVTYATGTTPDFLAPIVERRVQEGTSVILLANNPGDPEGPARLVYEAGQGALRAGGLLLSKVNVNHFDEVIHVIQEALGRGVRGEALTAYLRDLYTFSSGETPALAAWERPNAAEEVHARLGQMLKRLGMSEEECQVWPKTGGGGEGTPEQ